MKKYKDCTDCMNFALPFDSCKKACLSCENKSNFNDGTMKIEAELIEGCEFCKDKKEKMRESGEFNFAFSIEDNELWAYDGYMDGGAAIKIKLLPDVR